MLIVDKHCAVFTHNEVVICSLEFGTLLHLWLYKQYMGKKDNKRSMAIKTSDQKKRGKRILYFIILFAKVSNLYLEKKTTVLGSVDYWIFRVKRAPGHLYLDKTSY